MEKDKELIRAKGQLSAAAVFLLLAVLGMLTWSGLALTAKAEIADNRMNEIVALTADSLVPNLLMTVMALGALILALWIMERLGGMRMSAGLLALWLAAALCFVWGIELQSRADCKQVVEAARCFAQGDYSPLETDYFNVLSYQLGICLLLEGLARIVPGLDLNLLMQGVNAVLSVLTAGSLAALSAVLSGKRETGTAAVLLYAAFLPMTLFCVFVYGTLPMMLLCALAMLCFVRYIRTRRWGFGVGYALLMGCALVVKPNAAVPLIALIICALLDVMESRDWKLLGFAVLSAILAVALPHAVTGLYELRSGVVLREDVSMLARLAMGMQESPIASGWYTGFIEEFWPASVTAEQEKAAALAELSARLRVFREEPAAAAAFFGEKALTQWLEPAYDMLWYGSVCEKAGRFNGLAHMIYREGSPVRALLEKYMNIDQQVMYLLACVGTAGVLRRRRDSIQLILPVTILGGFLYHMIFEAKSQYIYVYALFMIPLAAQGLCAVRDRLQNAWRGIPLHRAD